MSANSVSFSHAVDQFPHLFSFSHKPPSQPPAPFWHLYRNLILSVTSDCSRENRLYSSAALVPLFSKEMCPKMEVFWFCGQLDRVRFQGTPRAHINSLSLPTRTGYWHLATDTSQHPCTEGCIWGPCCVSCWHLSVIRLLQTWECELSSNHDRNYDMVASDTESVNCDQIMTESASVTVHSSHVVGQVLH